MKKLMMHQENSFENSLNISTVTGLKNMFSAGGTVLNKREHMWNNEAQEQSTCSELHFVLCFILIPCLGVQIQTHRDITFQTPFM
jgi:hypothetical protein